MVNAPEMLREQRLRRILSIQTSIEKPLYADKKINYQELIIASASNLGISMRTSKEYVDMALFNLKLTKEDLNKNGT